MCDRKGKSTLGTQIAKVNSIKPFHIYQKLGCYNSPPLIERNAPVAHHDRSQDASRVRTEMANLALIQLVTSRPPTANGPPTPAHSARGPHSVPTVRKFSKGQKSLFNDSGITTDLFPCFDLIQTVSRITSRQVTHPFTILISLKLP